MRATRELVETHIIGKTFRAGIHVAFNLSPTLLPLFLQSTDFWDRMGFLTTEWRSKMWENLLMASARGEVTASWLMGAWAGSGYHLSNALWRFSTSAEQSLCASSQKSSLHFRASLGRMASRIKRRSSRVHCSSCLRPSISHESRSFFEIRTKRPSPDSRLGV